MNDASQNKEADKFQFGALTASSIGAVCGKLVACFFASVVPPLLEAAKAKN